MEFALRPTRLQVIAPRARTPRAPRGLERRYETALRRVSRAMAAEVAQELRQVLATATDGPRADAEIDVALAFARLAGLRVNLLQIVARALPLLDRFGNQIRDENAAEMRRVLPISIADQSPEVQAAVLAWRAENVRLITSRTPRARHTMQVRGTPRARLRPCWPFH